MADKELKAIMKLRYDTYTDWTTKNPILRAGETAYVLIESESADVQPVVLTKVGNGIDNFSTLPWTSGNAADVYDWAKAETKPTYAATEITGLDTKISAATSEMVRYTEQTLTDEQKAQVRNNIGAINADESTEITEALIITSITSEATDNELPSAKAVYTAIQSKDLLWTTW